MSQALSQFERVVYPVCTVAPMDEPFILVPGPTARWWPEINEFALTYNGYIRNGDFDVVSGIDERVRLSWERDASLPDEIGICRATLFFEQRLFRDLDTEPSGSDDRFIRAVLERIRELSGGEVPGPSDEVP